MCIRRGGGCCCCRSRRILFLFFLLLILLVVNLFEGRGAADALVDAEVCLEAVGFADQTLEDAAADAGDDWRALRGVIDELSGSASPSAVKGVNGAAKSRLNESWPILPSW